MVLLSSHSFWSFGLWLGHLGIESFHPSLLSDLNPVSFLGLTSTLMVPFTELFVVQSRRLPAGSSSPAVTQQTTSKTEEKRTAGLQHT